MSRRRWIADEVTGDHAALTGAHAQHLSRVLRARVGQTFEIATGTGTRLGTVTEIMDSRVDFELGEVVVEEPAPQISLALAIFKFDRMEWAIEKCTELGVSRIIPVMAQRSERHLAAAASKRVERWRRVARQAAEQSRRTSPPEIADTLKVGDLVRLRVPRRVVLSESERGLMLKDAVSAAEGEMILAVGPEGGWTPSEMELFSAASWTSASLGPTILRAETAAIAGLAISLAELHR